MSVYVTTYVTYKNIGIFYKIWKIIKKSHKKVLYFKFLLKNIFNIIFKKYFC